MLKTVLLKDKINKDKRGIFIETWNSSYFKKLGIQDSFVQDNFSKSFKKGTLRGMHLQIPPFDQAKLVRCIRGEILDIVVDVRKGSPDYGRYKSYKLSSDNHKQLYVPSGFLHGFLTLTDNVEVAYKCSNLYSKKHEITIMYNDPEINIKWPLKKFILSPKDQNNAILFKKFINPFKLKK